MNERTEKIHQALNVLCKALDLSGESGTEALFLILSSTFNDNNVQEIEDVLQERSDGGLAYDMNCLMAEKIDEVAKHYSDSQIPPWNQ